MHSSKILLSISFILLTPFEVYSDSAVQTDWSGGAGIPGPVWDWSNEFYQSSCIDWSYYPGSLLLTQCIYEHIIDDNINAFDGDIADIDGDSDNDVVGAGYSSNEITWWENSDGTGSIWIEHVIDSAFDGACSVFPIDIDDDNDIDVVGAAFLGNKIYWWENADGAGTNWILHVVDEDFNGARGVYASDIDDDGDIDVIGAADYANCITWWENMDGAGTSWTQHDVDSAFEGAQEVYSADVNNDGNEDILGAAIDDDEITWWENVDSLGTTWTEHKIDSLYDGASSVYAIDINGDGYCDVVGASYLSSDITWWENTDGTGVTWVEHTVESDFSYARSVYAHDIDGDVDQDIAGAAMGGYITWWENTDGLGTSWIAHPVDEDFNSAISVTVGDINGDSDADILGSACGANEITWWDLNAYSPVGTLESSIFEVPWPVCYSIEWGMISWLGTEPSDTELSFLVRASDDPGNLGPWSDTITVSGTSLAGLLGEYDGYLQYMAILETVNPDTTSILDEITIDWVMLGIDDTVGPIPAGTSLLPIAPNPAKGTTVIRFVLPEPASVEISIFDLLGRLVSEIHSEEYSHGFHDVILSDLSSGIYFCRMISGDFSATQRFVVIE